MTKYDNKTKTVVLVNSISNTKKLKKYLKTNREYTVIALTTEVQKKLEKENIYCKTPSDYLTHKALEEIEQNARLWIKTWPNTKMDSKSFTELVAYSDTSLWWFVSYTSFKTVITNIELVKHILKKGNQKKILIFGNTPLEEISRALRGVEVKKVKEKQLNIRSVLDLKDLIKKHPNLIWNICRMYDILKLIVAKMILKRGYELNNHKFKRTILIYTHNLDWRTVYDPLTKQPRTCDSSFESIIKELEKAAYKLVTTFPLGYLTTHPWTSFIAGLKATIGRREHGMLHKPFEYYLTRDIDKKANIQRKELLKVWNKLKNDERFKNSLKYQEVNLWPLLKSDFLFFFSFVAGHAVKNIEMASRMIDIERPNLFLTSGGGDYFCELSLITQSTLNNIPSLEIQHGVITHNCTTYIHPKGRISYKMAVYGAYYKDILTEANEFSLDSVVVTGQPRYDILAKADEIFNKEDFCKRFHLNLKKKIVLIITEDLPNSDKSVLECSFRALKKNRDVQIVIKPHPTEVGTRNEKIMKRELVKATVLPKFENIFEAIHACDLLINTTFSTTTIEAAILGKPVITSNLAGYSDTIFGGSGVTIGVYKEEDFASAIKGALYNDEVRKKLAAARKKFVYQHAYLQDGQASKRVVDLIMQMIEESKR